MLTRSLRILIGILGILGSATLVLVNALPNGHNVIALQTAFGTNQSPQDSRIAKWFDAYDDIRRAAKMTPQEKELAKRLLTAAIDEPAIPLPSASAAGDKAAGRALLNSMVARYREAASRLSTLPTIPETEKLQKSYERYFITGGNVFQQYLQVMDNNKLADKSSFKHAKHAMTLLHATNKALDKKLRQQYNLSIPD